MYFPFAHCLHIRFPATQAHTLSTVFGGGVGSILALLKKPKIPIDLLSDCSHHSLLRITSEMGSESLFPLTVLAILYFLILKS